MFDWVDWNYLVGLGRLAGSILELVPKNVMGGVNDTSVTVEARDRHPRALNRQLEAFVRWQRERLKRQHGFLAVARDQLVGGVREAPVKCCPVGR